MTSTPDILIIGGGVIGLTTAYFLAREGAKVTIVDKGDFGQESSWAGAGIIPPPEGAEGAPIDVLRRRSAEMFPSLSNELREKTGIDNGYLRCGGLEFTGHGGQPEEWHQDPHEPLDEAAIKHLEPALAPGLGQAFHLPEMAQVRNPRHIRALVAACQALGVTLRRACPVHSFVRQGNRITAVRCGDETLAAERILVTSGAWSASLLEVVRVRLPIKPIRGQIALLSTPAPLVRHILLWGSRYLVPRGDGKVLVGSTEEDVGFDKRTTDDAVQGLVGLAHKLVPGLKDAELERSWAGLRPGSPDGVPFLGLAPGLDNLYVAAGHYRAGILLSPATGLVMMELLLGRRPFVDLTPLRVARFDGEIRAQARAEREAARRDRITGEFLKVNQQIFDTLIAEIDTECRRLKIPMLGPQKAARLCELVWNARPDCVVEVGTAIGYSALWIAKTLRELGHGRVITLEKDADRAAQAKKNFERAGLDSLITQLIGDARERIGEVEGPIDLLFLDGGFANYYPCFMKCRDKLRDGALLIADNAGIGATEMADYLSYVREHFDSSTEWFETDLEWNPRDAMEISTYKAS